MQAFLSSKVTSAKGEISLCETLGGPVIQSNDSVPMPILVREEIGNSSLTCWAEIDNATGYVWGRTPHLFTITFDDAVAPQTFGGNATQSTVSSQILSAGAIAGVTIGSVFCILAIIIIVLLCRSRRPRIERNGSNGIGLNRRSTNNAPDVD
jgi:hypothetical protein